MNDVRPAAVAGSWYPGTAERLARDVDAYLSAARVDGMPTPMALVAPHAGLRYSGPVAAFAYRTVAPSHPAPSHPAPSHPAPSHPGTAAPSPPRTLAPSPYSSIVLVGPSHFVGFDGVSVWPRGAWETPFGPVAIDEPLASAIAAATPVVVEHPAAHAREHSLELQMPFIAHLCPGVPIVPLVMGHQRRTTAFALGDALARVISDRAQTGAGRVLLIASSDLSHFHDASVAAAMDAVVMERVAQLDPDGLMAQLEEEPHHACGGGPIVAVLRAARQLGAAQARVLKYADSGDISGDKSSVVGYMAAAIW